MTGLHFGGNLPQYPNKPFKPDIPADLLASNAANSLEVDFATSKDVQVEPATTGANNEPDTRSVKERIDDIEKKYNNGDYYTPEELLNALSGIVEARVIYNGDKIKKIIFEISYDDNGKTRDKVYVWKFNTPDTDTKQRKLDEIINNKNVSRNELEKILGYYGIQFVKIKENTIKFEYNGKNYTFQFINQRMIDAHSEKIKYPSREEIDGLVENYKEKYFAPQEIVDILEEKGIIAQIKNNKVIFTAKFEDGEKVYVLVFDSVTIDKTTDALQKIIDDSKDHQKPKYKKDYLISILKASGINNYTINENNKTITFEFNGYNYTFKFDNEGKITEGTQTESELRAKITSLCKQYFDGTISFDVFVSNLKEYDENAKYEISFISSNMKISYTVGNISGDYTAQLNDKNMPKGYFYKSAIDANGLGEFITKNSGAINGYFDYAGGEPPVYKMNQTEIKKDFGKEIYTLEELKAAIDGIIEADDTSSTGGTNGAGSTGSTASTETTEDNTTNVSDKSSEVMSALGNIRYNGTFRFYIDDYGEVRFVTNTTQVHGAFNAENGENVTLTEIKNKLKKQLLETYSNELNNLGLSESEKDALFTVALLYALSTDIESQYVVTDNISEFLEKVCGYFYNLIEKVANDENARDYIKHYAIRSIIAGKTPAPTDNYGGTALHSDSSKGINRYYQDDHTDGSDDWIDKECFTTDKKESIQMDDGQSLTIYKSTYPGGDGSALNNAMSILIKDYYNNYKWLGAAKISELFQKAQIEAYRKMQTITSQTNAEECQIYGYGESSGGGSDNFDTAWQQGDRWLYNIGNVILQVMFEMERLIAKEVMGL